MNTILLVILMIIINMVGTWLGWLFTEYEPTRISRLKWLNWKPFTCKPCLTFWIITTFQITTAIILSSIPYGIIAITLALFTFGALKMDEKNNVE